LEPGGPPWNDTERAAAPELPPCAPGSIERTAAERLVGSLPSRRAQSGESWMKRMS
jgi:hypothetical protein